MFPRKAILKNRLNYFHGCCFSFCYCPLTDVNCDCRYGSPFPSFPNLLTVLYSTILLMRAEVVQDCERSWTCWRFSLWSSVRPGRQSPVFLLQRSGHTADVRMSQGIHTWYTHGTHTHTVQTNTHTIFFYSASDDRYGHTLPDKWSSVPARTWCEWLRSPHGSHSSTLGEDLPSTLFHHDGLLHWHFQVRHKHSRTPQS